MKKLFAAAALAALLVSPAITRISSGHGRPEFSSGPSATPWDAVIVEGKIVGQDPDANVRLDMRRDAESLGKR